jgi:VPDSG-CTERM motif
MNKLRPILLALTAVATLLVAYPAKANLITNGGFETGDFTGWTVSPPTTFFVGSSGLAGPHSGSFEAFASTPFPPHEATLGQSVATTQGQSYTVDFWAANLEAAALTVSAGTTVFNYLFTGATGYTEFTFTFVAQGASSLILFNVAAQNFLFLDDISVNPVGVPDSGTTVSLLGCALLGLTAARRKLGC